MAKKKKKKVTKKKNISKKTIKKKKSKSGKPQGAKSDDGAILEIGGDIISEEEENAEIPSILPVLAANDVVIFPDMVAPLSVGTEREMQMIERSLVDNRMLVVAPLERDMGASDDIAAIHPIGCAAVVLKMIKLPDGDMRILLQGIKRVRIKKYIEIEPDARAEITILDEIITDTLEMKGLHSSIRKEFSKLTSMLQFPEEIRVAAHNINHPGRFADLVTSNIDITHEERMILLDELDVKRRFEKLSVMLGRNIQIVEIGSRIQEDVREKIGEGQREFFLREQLKAIRKELGEDDGSFELDEIEEKIEKSGMPEEARKEANREFSRLEKMQAGSAEYTVSMTYLDWLTTLPWQEETKDSINIRKAREILDNDHYNLKKVKERIIEYLAVKKINPEGRSPILCLVGPPGVGKTSLGRSIARAMGRKFVRHSLGGVRDEAEIRGHRRTYIGALPGRIIQGLRRAESRNPIFMLDEIDKLVSDFRGDPSSALLEALDPEQNNEFTDHYLDVQFDLSKVIFIATANTTDTIPDALYDRMEVISLPGYSTMEKHKIANRHLIPRIYKDHGIKLSQIKINKTALDMIIRGYTREAGLRNLEREIATVIRKIAVKIASGKKGPFTITPEMVKQLLGPIKYFGEVATRANLPGVAIGLVWTSVGGDILYIESTNMQGSKNLQLTGSLGEVIKESAQAALSWIRTNANGLGIDPEFYENSDIHIHFPEGATPKDGPSAGVALVASLISLLLNKRIKPRLAMTGEMTLRGKVLPVGGIKEKMIGAHLAGIKEVIIPHENRNDLIDLPQEVLDGITFHTIKDVTEMLPIAFPTKFANPIPVKKHRKKAKASRK